MNSEDELLVSVLKDRVKRNYSEYYESLSGLGLKALVNIAGDIAAMSDAWQYLISMHDFKPDELEFLLKLENPLEVVAYYWEQSHGQLDQMKYTMEFIGENHDYILDEFPLVGNSAVNQDKTKLHWNVEIDKENVSAYCNLIDIRNDFDGHVAGTVTVRSIDKDVITMELSFHAPAGTGIYYTGEKPLEGEVAIASNGELRVGDYVLSLPDIEYGCLVGRVTDIDKIGSEYHIEGNTTDDIRVDFSIGHYSDHRITEIEDEFSKIYMGSKKYEDLPLDDVIMAPEDLFRLDECNYGILDVFLNSYNEAKIAVASLGQKPNSQAISEKMAMGCGKESLIVNMGKKKKIAEAMDELGEKIKMANDKDKTL